MASLQSINARLTTESPLHCWAFLREGLCLFTMFFKKIICSFSLGVGNSYRERSRNYLKLNFHMRTKTMPSEARTLLAG